jgi:hypothetical protein
MMPPGDVFEIAQVKVLHGAVRLQGLASSPTPDRGIPLDRSDGLQHGRDAFLPACLSS